MMDNWIKRLRTTVAMAVVVGGLAQAAVSETLGDALVGAYNHSGLLDQNRALLRAADEDVASAAATLLPIINWSADLTRNFGSTTQFQSTSLTAAITGSIQLFDFGADANRIEAFKEVVLSTRANLTSIEQQVLLRAVTAFMNVRRAAETVALRQNNVRLLTEELRAANDRFDVGEVTRTDVALAEAAQAQARSNLAAAQGDLIQAQEEYRNAVGRKPGPLAPPPGLPAVETNAKRATAIAYRNHPDLAAVQRQVAASELRILAAEADMKATVTLDGRLTARENFSTDNFTRGGSIGIQADGPIYRGGALSSAVRSAIATRDSQRANLHVVKHNVQQDVGNAIADLFAARAQLMASERQIAAARVAFDGVREEAKLGARTTLDVLDAEQELLDAQANRIAAQANQYIAAYALLAAKGLLTAERLHLPVTLYDPAAYYNLVKDGVAKRSKRGQQLDRVLRALQK